MNCFERDKESSVIKESPVIMVNFRTNPISEHPFLYDDNVRVLSHFAFSPDSSTLAIPYYRDGQGCIDTIDTNTGMRKEIVSLGEQYINAISFSADNSLMAISHTDKKTDSTNSTKPHHLDVRKVVPRKNFDQLLAKNLLLYCEKAKQNQSEKSKAWCVGQRKQYLNGWMEYIKTIKDTEFFSTDSVNNNNASK